ncbi:MAG: hypothetical protein K0R54_4277 [Clostridiaceae bacterium]|jgi:O-phosphoseryl-tRNA(Cys) synthetase|nr:hypothetical protein [Clostridiaceae bacterium]
MNEKKRVVIDFLFLDLSTCTRCQGTNTNLDEAIEDVSTVLEAADFEVIVNKIHVTSEEEAIKYKFLSSPTIRVNSHDIQLEVKESLCESCGDLCGSDVNCRVFVYEGEEYTEPPKAMIIEGVLKEIYGKKDNAEKQDYTIPKNLKKFYTSIEKKSSLSDCCCSGKGNNCCK